MPLTRERWIKFNWLGDPPVGVAHEIEVPAPWRDPPEVEA
jgi:hypothetical protein